MWQIHPHIAQRIAMGRRLCCGVLHQSSKDRAKTLSSPMEALQTAPLALSGDDKNDTSRTQTRQRDRGPSRAREPEGERGQERAEEVGDHTQIATAPSALPVRWPAHQNAGRPANVP